MIRRNAHVKIASPAAMLTASMLLLVPCASALTPGLPVPANQAPDARTTSPGPSGPSEALASLAALARERPASVAMRDIATSPGGRPVTLWTLSADPSTADARPGVLLVGGLDADRPAHVTIAADAARKLVETRGDLLERVTVYVIPCANPDAILGGALRAEGSPSRNARPVDDDRDGTADEDGPKDLDGNGIITTMRRSNPPPGVAATHAADPAEPRLLRKADPLAGARPEFSVHDEGIDADGDGLIGEDPAGGVDVDCNFPARWPEFASHSGAFQLSEPEAAAIATFVLEHPRLAGALCLGRWESLARTPDPKPRDATGKTPMELDAGDEAMWRNFGAAWRDSSGQSRWTDSDPSGSLALWLYAHRGLPAFSTQGWGRPDVPKEEGSDEKASDTPAEGTKAPRGAPRKKDGKPADEEAAAWLAVSDTLRGGAGFVPWTPLEHPTLGAVEVGGFDPHFRRNPPADAQPRISDAACALVALIGERRPHVRIDSVTVEELAPDVRRIRLRIANEGWLPTATAMGRTNEAPGPVVVRTDAAPDAILSGTRASRIAALGGFGAADLEWIVKQPDSVPIRIDVHWRGMDPQSAFVEGRAVRLVGVPPSASEPVKGGAQ
jgi:hypothetical protein